MRRLEAASCQQQRGGLEQRAFGVSCRQAYALVLAGRIGFSALKCKQACADARRGHLVRKQRRIQRGEPGRTDDDDGGHRDDEDQGGDERAALKKFAHGAPGRGGCAVAAAATEAADEELELVANGHQKIAGCRHDDDGAHGGGQVMVLSRRRCR